VDDSVYFYVSTILLLAGVFEMQRVRLFKCVGYPRVVGTFSENRTVSLLAGALDGLKRVTWRVRDCHCSGNSGFSPAYHSRFCLQGPCDIMEFGSRIREFPGDCSVCFKVLIVPLLAGVLPVPTSTVL